jgi:hypothetical protein
MINAETFLANLHNSDSSLLAAQHLESRDYPELPFSVVQALNRRWRIAPVLSHSIAASVRRTMACVPTSDPSRLVPIARKHPDCNWAVQTGNGLLILEVNTELGLPSLRNLCRNTWEWRETLRFRSGAVQFFAFHYVGRRVRFLGTRFPGLKSHWNGSAVLLPPSWFVFGPPVSYVSEIEATVLDAPSWLLEGIHPQQQNVRP